MEKTKQSKLGRKINDLSGMRFGWLSVLFLHPYRNKHKQTQWVCVCDCGNYITLANYRLTSDKVKCCGCTKKPHRMSFTPTHRSWHGMRNRCLNPNVPEYKNYGGRGIKVCERWKYFKNFLEDMGPRPDGYSLERIDVNGNYEPSNCKWIPLRKQNHNIRAKGYCWKKNRNKYQAYIKRDKKYFTLGSYNTPEEAAAAYSAAKIEYEKHGTVKGITPCGH